MKKVFIDTDVILDLLMDREPHLSSSQELFSLIDQKTIEGFVSSLSFSNLHYILRKLKSNREVVQALSKLKAMVNVLPVDSKIVDLALDSNFKDFEDALQYYTAAENHIPCLITRNTKDFKKGHLVVCTAEEYLNMRNQKEK